MTSGNSVVPDVVLTPDDGMVNACAQSIAMAISVSVPRLWLAGELLKVRLMSGIIAPIDSRWAANVKAATPAPTRMKSRRLHKSLVIKPPPIETGFLNSAVTGWTVQCRPPGRQVKAHRTISSRVRIFAPSRTRVILLERRAIEHDLVPFKVLSSRPWK